MKKKICSLAFCFVIHMGFSQFQHSFGTERSEMGNALTQLDKIEKGYLIAGYTGQQFFGGLDATLVKTDLDGDQIWSRVYGGRNRDYFNSVRQYKDINSINQATYIVAGVTNSFGFGRADALLTGVNIQGVPVFAAVYGGERRDVANCVQNIKDENGRPGHIFVGETRSYTAIPENNIYVVRTDLSGNLTRATVIGNRGNQKGSWIEQTKDGGYIIVGSTTNYWCGGGAQLTNPATDIFIVKLKADLTVEWDRILGYPKELDPSIRHNNVATCVKINQRGNYVITGYTNSFGINNSQDAFLLFMNSNGSFLGMKTYGTKYTEMGHSLQISKSSTGNELYTVVGQHSSASRKALVFQTDASSTLQWARDYGDEKQDGGMELVKDDFDNGFAFTGFTTSLGAGGTDIYLVETTADGESKTICEEKIDLKEEKHEPCIARIARQIFVRDYRRIELPVERVEYKEDRCVSAKLPILKKTVKEYGIELFPNPVHDLLTIQINKRVTVNKIEVYSLQGRIIMQESHPIQASMILSTKDLERGTYIVKIYTDLGETKVMKFIKK
ncbi:T9SS type A sorting domain-containing protein [Aquimarina sp. RZ0]|uniref:T9SS type A sorting domain-containing protein n=1 Tax=Aquimarina sp. RZ0 TaxID=2607730 RepID=UPI0011F218B6|nr:T9SS type A sorting domain-containing protein [Aquimarina sp. RZ0]KAA1243440.1 T9SS type A sorting domain-containing protein [Aquimarina sp. RZ0]